MPDTPKLKRWKSEYTNRVMKDFSATQVSENAVVLRLGLIILWQNCRTVAKVVCVKVV